MAVKEIARNKKAYHDYFIEDTFEAGLVLQGTEIKSLRNGKASFQDAYISFSNGEAWIKGLHIAVYTFGTYNNHDADRTLPPQAFPWRALRESNPQPSDP